MNAWTLALYVFASFLALRSLVSLMSGYQGSFKEQRLIQELEKYQAGIDAQIPKLADFGAANADATTPVTTARRAA